MAPSLEAAAPTTMCLRADVGYWSAGDGRYASAPLTEEEVYSPSPAGRGRGEGQIALERALAGPLRPYNEVKTAIGAMPTAAAGWVSEALKLRAGFSGHLRMKGVKPHARPVTKS